MTKGLIFSGVQPTGNLHLGNYLGAIKQWVGLQDEYECIYCIVDLHAITQPQEPEELRDNIRSTAAAYIACGINPDNNIIYNQSAVAGHAELAWILGCYTPLGWLNRMTQFKEKAGKHKENAALGLYSYPVLMAADILLYKATHVPVGDDQKQHLELAREIAGAFNHRHFYSDDNQNAGYFPLPEPLILGTATRVMSLRDGTRKMSKSEESDNSRINLTDIPDDIARKFRKAKSDAEVGFDDLDERPEARNLLVIYAALGDISLEQAQAEFSGKGFGDLKKALADVAVQVLSPVSAEMNKLMNDRAYLDKILHSGKEKASAMAEKNLKEIKEIVGFL